MGYREIMADDDETAEFPQEAGMTTGTGEQGPGTAVEAGDNEWDFATEEPAVTAAVAKEEPYQEKYQSLKGKYDAETQRQREEIRLLREELAAKNSAPRIDPKAGYGEWVGQMMEGDAEGSFDRFAPVVSSLVQDEVRKAVEPYRNMAAQSAQVSFDTTLSARVPGWQQINDSPEFAQFLDSTEPLTGQTYRDLGTDAFNKQDATRAALLFSTFQERSKRPGFPQQMLSPGRTTATAQTTAPRQVTGTMLNSAEEQFRRGKITEEKYEAIQDAYLKQRLSAQG